MLDIAMIIFLTGRSYPFQQRNHLWKLQRARIQFIFTACEKITLGSNLPGYRATNLHGIGSDFGSTHIWIAYNQYICRSSIRLIQPKSKRDKKFQIPTLLIAMKLIRKFPHIMELFFTLSFSAVNVLFMELFREGN